MPITRSRHENEQRQHSTTASATASATETTAQSASTGTTGTSAVETTTTEQEITVQETAVQTEAAVPTQHIATEQKRPPTERCKSRRSRKSERAARLAQAKQELLRLKIELAAATMEAIEAESDSDSEESVETEQRTTHRVTEWLNKSQSQILAIEAQPHFTPQQAEPEISAPQQQEESPLRATDEEITEKIEAPLQTAKKPGNEERKISVSHPVPVAIPSCIVTEEQQKTISQPTATNINLTELASAIALAAKTPHPLNRHFHELPHFNGSHQEWMLFRATFADTKPSYTESENIARLRRSLKGLAKEAVESLLIFGAPTEEIMKTLETRFGRPDAIAVAELERLRTLPRLSDAPKDICTFATRINNIVATLKMLKKNHYLYNPEVTKVVVEKLTPVLRYRWFDFAATDTEEDADLLKLSRFMQQEAEKCSPYAQPETARATEPEFKNQPRNYRKQKTYTTADKPADTVCPICDKNGHDTARCHKYTEADNNRRWQLSKEKSLCFSCLQHRTKTHKCKPKKCGIDGCSRTHHESLHFQRQPTEEPKTEVVTSTWSNKQSQSYLKILPVQVSGPKGKVDTFALLDDGSTVTLVDSGIIDKIGTKGRSEPLHIEAIGNAEVKATDSRRVQLTLHGDTDDHKITAHTIEKLRVAPQKVAASDLADCTHLHDVALRLQYENATPGILIGQDNWHLLLATETRQGRRHQPVASHTPLGWVLHGSRTRILGHKIHRVNHLRHIDEEMDEQLRQYLAIENLIVEPKRPKSDPEERALTTLRDQTHRREDGRYETALLWKDDKLPMPQNRENAYRRLLNTEKRIDRDPQLKQKYNEQMSALLEKGYAEVAPQSTGNIKTWYLPHFPVINPMKPDKVRIVHDAAAKTRGVSLNDHLLTGPDLIQSLPGVIMKFRQHRVAVTADIAEMFMQVKIREQDRDALRYLWRGEARGDAEVTEYRMTSLIFGATSSPTTAIYVKNANAEEHKHQHPDAYRAIVNNHYVDDYLQSFPTEEEAIQTATDVRDIHRRAHYELRQWASNSATVLQALSTDRQKKPTTHLHDGSTTERVLGLIWRCSEDQLTFNLDMARLPSGAMDNDTPTKREVLKLIMSLFDPLGLAAPVTSRAKQILQEIWRRGTGWDQPIDNDLAPQWKEWIRQLRNLADVSIPRCYLQYSEAARLELHTFVDASEAAYSAALYWRTTTPDGEVSTSLVLAKARVAPLKLTSIPRLELQAAVMGSRMAAAVIEEHDRKPDLKTYWTDSKTVLTWLRNGARAYRPYVAHRIAAIEEHTTVSEWRWVPTKLNVADDATRDVPHNIHSKHRWFAGPEFLQRDPQMWPTETPTTGEQKTGEERTLVTQHHVPPTLADATPPATRFSSWMRLVRTTGRVLQFIELIKRRKEIVCYKRNRRNKEADPAWKRTPTKTPVRPTRPTNPKTNPNRQYIHMDAELLRRAEELLMRQSQQDSFGEEIVALQKQKIPSAQSRLKNLAIELVKGVLVIKSRIQKASDIPEYTKRPAVLDGRHPIARLYIDHVHRRLHHAGVETTLNEVKQRYWVIRPRPTVKTVLRNCLSCRIRRAKPTSPATGDHPVSRLAHHRRPFTYTGVDYFGPLTVTVGRSTQKRYVALFTCLTTRAVHLEVAGTLTTDSAIMALRRFIARRGTPTEIWSDNGTNLQGADRELRQSIDSATNTEASSRCISWRFIPPSAPFMGGAWERLVRSVKVALVTVLQERHPTEETLTTLLAEVECTVNSRPLTHVSVDPSDPEALTPNHFLLGGSANTAAPGEFTEGDTAGRAQWRASQRLADLFWSRWVKEYLPELQHRREPHSRGAQLRIGDLVLVADGTLPRNTWPRGVITDTYPGPDGIVRTADVRTKGGVLRRPTKKLVILPMDNEAARLEDLCRRSDDDTRRERCAAQKQRKCIDRDNSVLCK